METRPAAALIMSKADFLLEIAVIVLDTPAQLGEIDEAAERHVRVDGCEPVFGGLGLALGPFDEQRLFGENVLRPGSAQRARAHGQSAIAASRWWPSRHVTVRQARLGKPERQWLRR